MSVIPILILGDTNNSKKLKKNRMNKYISYLVSCRLGIVLVAFVMLFSTNQISAQNYCTNGCNSNTYVNSSDPNTIEYDAMVSTFHASIVKEKDGTFKVWGQQSGSDGTSDLLSPTVIDGTGTGNSRFTYTGKPLKATMDLIFSPIGFFSSFSR